MLTLRGLYEEGKIQPLDEPPRGTRSLVAVVFLDGMQDQIADAQETMLLGSRYIERLGMGVRRRAQTMAVDLNHAQFRVILTPV